MFVTMKQFIIFIFAVNLIQAQSDVPLTLRAQFNGSFGYTIIGNTMNEFDNWQPAPIPPCQMLTQSSATLNLLPNQTIVAAYLYWGGIGDGTFNDNITLNGLPYSAANTYVSFPEPNPFFSYFNSFRDITPQVLNSGNSVYSLANLNLNPIISDYCNTFIYAGGWHIVVIYTQIGLQNTQLNIYDGNNAVFWLFNDGATQLPINNLSVIDNSDAKMSIVSLNGSPNVFFNESITFNGNILSNSLNPANNPFNGTNSFTGSTTNWNQDIDTFEISPYISVGDTQASVVLNSFAGRFLQTIVTSVRSELPDATVQISQVTGQQICNNRDLAVNYTVSNINSNAVLPADVPVSFYANDVFLQTVNTPTSIPIGGTLPLQTTVVIPQALGNNIELRAVVNQTAAGLAFIAESNPDNNDASQSIILIGNTVTTVFGLQNSFCPADIVPVLPTVSDNGVSGAWLPNAINNQSSGSYVFTPTPGQCASNFILNVTISPNVNPTFNIANTFCQGATIPTLPVIATNNISGTWLPTVISNQSSGNYIFTPNTGQCGLPFTLNVTVSPNVNPTFTIANTFCQGASVPILPLISTNNISGTWLPNAISNQNSGSYVFTPNAGQCGLPFILNVAVSPNVNPAFSIATTFCQGESVPALPSTSTNNISGAWLPIVISNQNSGSYVFTPNTGSCGLPFTLNVVVSPNVNPIFTIANSFCQGANMPTLPLISTNNISGTWLPNVISNQNSGSYVFTPDVGSCGLLFTLNVTVSPNANPTFAIANSFCQGASILALPSISTNNISGTWLPNAISNQNSGSFVFTPNAGSCGLPFTFNVTVSPNVNPTFTVANTFCQGATVPPLPLLSTNNISGTWSPDVISSQNSGSYVFTPDILGQCNSVFTLNVIIETPDVNEETFFICEDADGNVIFPVTLNTELNSSNFTFSWSENGVSIANNLSFLTAFSAGNYEVVASPINSGCEIVFRFEVLPLQPITVIIDVPKPDFDANQTILVNASGGSGQYIYSFDDLPFQSNPVFNVPDGGSVSVVVKDANGCYTFSQTVVIWQYPRFFTPNNDSFNDTWGINTQKQITTEIFDRYGRFIKQLINNQRWDGTSNAQTLPSTDYWFVVYYDENKVYRSHFSLKR
jgi:gliding motility-associated-like protein